MVPILTKCEFLMHETITPRWVSSSQVEKCEF